MERHPGSRNREEPSSPQVSKEQEGNSVTAAGHSWFCGSEAKTRSRAKEKRSPHQVQGQTGKGGRQERPCSSLILSFSLPVAPPSRRSSRSQEACVVPGAQSGAPKCTRGAGEQRITASGKGPPTPAI